MIVEPQVPQGALAAIRAPFEATGAAVVAPPVIQPLNLFLDLAGETMRTRLFIVQAEGREEACLRPDLTIPTARIHIASGAVKGRYRYEGRAFRAPPRGDDQGHPEEFLQVGYEAYGPGEPIAAEAEAAGLAWRAASAGGREDLSLRLGDAGLFAAFLDAIDVDGAPAARLRRAFGRPTALAAELDRVQAPAAGSGGGLPGLLGGLPEAEAAKVLQELWALAGIQPVGGRPPQEIVRRLVQRADADRAPRLSGDQVTLIGRFLAVADAPEAAMASIATLAGKGGKLGEALSGWSIRLAAMAKAGAPLDRMRLEAGFGRAFAYYDGFVFDVVSKALGDERPVAGGGRYDSLLVRLGAADPVGAVGCMVRPARAWKESGR